MPRPRLHKDNAAKQKAYRERKKRAEAEGRATSEALVRRVMRAEK